MQTVSAELKKYKELYAQNIAEINALRQALADMETKQNEIAVNYAVVEEEKTENEISFEDIKETEIPVTELEPSTQYGAQIIGKIILDGTKISNTFAENQNAFSIDLINLVLGKTEVCKAAIYDICHSDKSDDEKMNLIDAVYSECADYFNGLTKQI